MKIIITPYSQLGNKLWSIADIVAHSLIYREKCVVLNFLQYKHLFPNLKKHPYIYFFPILVRHRIFRIMDAIQKPLTRLKILKPYRPDFSTRGASFVHGWHQRDCSVNLEQKQAEIRHLFAPAQEVVDSCTELFKKMRAENDIIIGIHWRRGDYSGFLGGKYFYDAESIRNYMLQLKEMVAPGKIAFFIASNSEVKKTDFDGFTVFTNENSDSMMYDLYSLGLCDLIIGPPSTFSPWASWYGKKPLKLIHTKDEQLKPEDFEMIKSLHTFASGKTWDFD